MTALIEMHGLSKTFRMGDAEVFALREIDLRIAANEYIAVVGTSGSGKTTLMNILGCLDRQSGGSYVLAGERVATLNDRSLSRIRNREIGFVFQNFCLFPRMSAVENVMQPLIYRDLRHSVRHSRAAAALERVGLQDRQHHLPAEMSGGQRQRVAIARALVSDPSILLADEPTGNLDTETAAQILDIFDELHASGQTIIIVTHDTRIANHCRRQVALMDGRIVSDTRR